jgi:hypothetical protein
MASSGLGQSRPAGRPRRFDHTIVFLNSGPVPAQRPHTGPEYLFKETKFDFIA